MKRTDWKQVKHDYLTSNIKLKDLAAKYHIKVGTLRSHKSRNHWSRGSKSSHKNVATQRNKKSNVAKNDATEISVEELNKSGLNDKRQLFCLLYLKWYNATKAYKHAYHCKLRTAQQNGWLLLNNTEVQHELTKLRQKRVNQLHIDQSDVLAKLVKMYFANIGDYVRFGNTTDTDIETGKKFKRSVVYFRNQDEVDTEPIAEIKHGKDGPEIKLPDKVKVAKLLLKYLPAPINHNVKSDTLINALKSGLKNQNNHKR